MTVYLDGVFVLNLLVNYLLLKAAARLGASAGEKLRLWGASAVGAAYAVAVYLPYLGFLQGIPVKLAFGALMVVIAFGAKRQTLRLGAVFAAVSLVLCGAIYGVELLRNGKVRTFGNSLFYPVTFSSLVLTAGATYAACRLLLPRLTHSPDSIVPVTVSLRGRQIRVSALQDSGNTLADPVSGEGVLVAEWSIARRLLPESIALEAEDFAAPDHLMLRLRPYCPRLIPYRAVGVQGGLLLALPCRVGIGKQSPKNSLVAFSPTPLSDGGAYEALTGGMRYG